MESIPDGPRDEVLILFPLDQKHSKRLIEPDGRKGTTHQIHAEKEKRVSAPSAFVIPSRIGDPIRARSTMPNFSEELPNLEDGGGKGRSCTYIASSMIIEKLAGSLMVKSSRAEDLAPGGCKQSGYAGRLTDHTATFKANAHERRGTTRREPEFGLSL